MLTEADREVVAFFVRYMTARVPDWERDFVNVDEDLPSDFDPKTFNRIGRIYSEIDQTFQLANDPE